MKRAYMIGKSRIVLAVSKADAKKGAPDGATVQELVHMPDLDDAPEQWVPAPKKAPKKEPKKEPEKKPEKPKKK